MKKCDLGLEKTWFTNKYYYYKRRDPLLTSSKWSQLGYDVSQESDLSKELQEISSKLKQLVLNLSRTNGTYYANGDPDKAPTINETLKIEVTDSGKVHNIYKRYKHAPTGGSRIRLLSTKASGKNIPFYPPVYESEYREVCVYFWSLDSGHTNPLLLELKPASGIAHSYYILHKTGRTDKKWKVDPQVTNSTLKRVLDRENCRNGVHIIDISQKGSYGRYISYPCPDCTSKWIGVSTYGTSYSYCFHYLYGSCYISGFKNGRTEQTGITLSGRISNVHVYQYPKGSDGIPLLIYLPLSSNKWFERISLDSNEWTEVSQGKKPESPFSSQKDKIITLLKAKLPTVTIDLGQTNADNGASGTYSGTSGETTKTIQFIKQGIGSGFVSFTYSVEKKDGFIVNLQHNGSPLQGIPQTLVVKSVKAYYDGPNPDDKNKLLVIGLEKRSAGPRDDYVYYSRETKASTWTVDLQKNIKSGVPPLLTELKELKAKLKAERKKSRESDGAEKSTLRKVLEGTVGTLATVGTVGVTVWKWSSIMSFLITRL
ncbi:hypothetical protein BEWA_008400 [Theileria equi strain WA]|uniref:Uncharacterized protein n=1 Tax=Theileria equi strain WA TaxID=1537102 RepID=L0B0V0_THEEQ|nr:hypothetical protein BEWA_008400 [Theileria equi strain WA]AFZ81430.1 hypothetical protein BEWA_008400 [Theileria equi strain WA]|eukprot:XP_004831096.1 hypothetical protein BEWA_008400 [Theileria equi strain WA]